MTKARDLANASTALSAVSATELGYVDGVTSAIQTQMDGKIAKTLTTTTGDIIYASGANTPARLGIGSTSQVLSVSGGVPAWATVSGAPDFLAGKNKIINGDFAINQRGFTSNTADAAYNFDRWLQGNLNGTNTVTPQTFSPGTAPVAGYEGKNYLQCVTASQTGTTYAAFSQRIESVRTFAGQTITLSFWAKATSGTPKVAFEWTQSFGTGGSPSSNNYGGRTNVTLSTSWTRYSITTTVDSLSGKTIGTGNNDFFNINIWLSASSEWNTNTNSIGTQNNTFHFWGMQVEAGSTATPFTTATGTLQGELAACQRYYWRNTATGSDVTMAAGYWRTTTASQLHFQYPVTMRTSPTNTQSSMGVQQGNGFYAITSTTYTGLGTVSAYIEYTASTASATAGAGSFAISNASGDYIEWNAEL